MEYNSILDEQTTVLMLHKKKTARNQWQMAEY